MGKRFLIEPDEIFDTKKKRIDPVPIVSTPTRKPINPHGNSLIHDLLSSSVSKSKAPVASTSKSHLNNILDLTTPKRASSPALPLSKKAETSISNLVHRSAKVETPTVKQENQIDLLMNVPKPQFKEEDDLYDVLMSPRKRKRGFVAGGLAEYGAASISSLNTSHSFWCHGFTSKAKNITAVAERSAVKNQLYADLEEYQPIRLQIMDILQIQSIESIIDNDDPVYGERKQRIMLTQCRVLHPVIGKEGEDEDVELGTVLFSILLASSSFRPKMPLPTSTNGSIQLVTTTAEMQNLMVKGQEVWVYEPYSCVTIPEADGDRKVLICNRFAVVYD